MVLRFALAAVTAPRMTMAAGLILIILIAALAMPCIPQAPTDAQLASMFDDSPVWPAS